MATQVVRPRADVGHPWPVWWSRVCGGVCGVHGLLQVETVVRALGMCVLRMCVWDFRGAADPWTKAWAYFEALPERMCGSTRVSPHDCCCWLRACWTSELDGNCLVVNY